MLLALGLGHGGWWGPDPDTKGGGGGTKNLKGQWLPGKQADNHTQEAVPHYFVCCFFPGVPVSCSTTRYLLEVAMEGPERFSGRAIHTPARPDAHTSNHRCWDTALWTTPALRLTPFDTT